MSPIQKESLNVDSTHYRLSTMSSTEESLMVDTSQRQASFIGLRPCSHKEGGVNYWYCPQLQESMVGLDDALIEIQHLTVDIFHSFRNPPKALDHVLTEN